MQYKCFVDSRILGPAPSSEERLGPPLCWELRDGKNDSICFTVISENKEHDNISVHLFQHKLISFRSWTEHFGDKPKRIIYMSDGCAGQYKNCYNFTNLCHHEEDFGIPAEWHFFATSHGKVSCRWYWRNCEKDCSKSLSSMSISRPNLDTKTTL